MNNVVWSDLLAFIVNTRTFSYGFFSCGWGVGGRQL